MENKMDNIELAMSILNRNILDKDLDAEAIKKAKQVIHSVRRETPTKTEYSVFAWPLG